MVKIIKPFLFLAVTAAIVLSLIATLLSSLSEESFRRKMAESAVFPEGKALINSSSFEVRVADTDKLRSIGLQFAESAEPGMFLLWDEPGYYGIWMQFTNLPISAAFIDKNGYITKIADLAPNSLTPVYASELTQAVLELPKGEFEKHDIKVGDLVRLERHDLQ